MLTIQHRCKIPMVQLCQQNATVLCDGVPLCGTHVNRPPEQVVVRFGGEIKATEKLR